jgi:hypothetical protein
MTFNLCGPSQQIRRFCNHFETTSLGDGQWYHLSCRVVLALFCAVTGVGVVAGSQPDGSRLILVHYMPWFEAEPESHSWGWHWTMNHFQPETVVGGRRQIASKFYPAIGPYASSDPLVIDYHLLLMKVAGIDGVIIDWYGRQRLHDYARLHRNTFRLVTRAGELGLKVVICYEDRTIAELVKQGKVPADGRAAEAAKEITWLAENWFHLDHYVKIDGKPLLLSFGTDNLTDAEWSDALQAVPTPVAYVSQRQKRTAAVGAFDWPVPSRGLGATEEFYHLTASVPLAIPTAFPRFDDIYEQANLHASYGNIPDDDGATFRKTLTAALKSPAPIIQIATWNDWGEGTVIEPSVEFGTRDLEVIQRLRKQHLQPSFDHTKDGLALPARLLNERREAGGTDRAVNLDALVVELARGAVDKVRSELSDGRKE